jgi:hypothetical protein
MPKTPLRAAAAIGGTADDVEAAFYEALQRGDIDALMACWADEDEVFCVHPGGPRLVGAVAIRAAFEQMFGNGASGPGRRGCARSSRWPAPCTTCSSASRCSRRRPAPCLRAGHQRLSQDRAGLAPGGAPRQPGQRERARRGERSAPDAALMPSFASPSLLPVWPQPALDYAAPRWLPGGNLQTIWAALYARRFDGPAPVYRRERWTAPDGDFIDVDFVDAPGAGSAASSSATRGAAAGAVPRPRRLLAQPLRRGLRRLRAAHGMAFAVPHFRGCSGELNPGAARLPLGRPRRDRLDPGAHARAARGPGGRCWPRACRSAAMR